MHAPKSTVIYDGYDKIFYLLYFIGRFLLLGTSYCLCIICSLYATGSLIILEATSFFCPVYTEEQIRQSNYKNLLERGDSDWSCSYIERTRLNYYALFELNLDIFEAKINDQLTFAVLIQTILYIIVALFLLLATIHHTCLFFYDIIFVIYSTIYGTYRNDRLYKVIQAQKQCKNNAHINNKNEENGKKSWNSNPKKKTGIKKWFYYCFCCNCICLTKLYKCFIKGLKTCMKCYFTLIMPHYYVDSKWRLFTLIYKEWFEILVQLYGLMLYGGIDWLHPNSNVLSQESYVIEAFAIVIGSNCIAGMYIIYI